MVSEWLVETVLQVAKPALFQVGGGGKEGGMGCTWGGMEGTWETKPLETGALISGRRLAGRLDSWLQKI